MLLNAMGFVNRSLYLTSKFFENKPVKNLINRGIGAEDLNDDTFPNPLKAIYSLCDIFG
jgi:transposase